MQHRCSRCGRDFGLELDGSGWHALYIGLLRFELLAENVNQRWLAEECPGLPLWDRDREDRVTRRTSSPLELNRYRAAGLSGSGPRHSTAKAANKMPLVRPTAD